MVKASGLLNREQVSLFTADARFGSYSRMYKRPDAKSMKIKTDLITLVRNYVKHF